MVEKPDVCLFCVEHSEVRCEGCGVRVIYQFLEDRKIGAENE